GFIGDDVEEIPDRSPEAVQIIHRPAPQVLVAVHVLARALVRELGEVMDLRTRCLIGVRSPDRFSGQFFSSNMHICGHVFSAVENDTPPAAEMLSQPYVRERRSRARSQSHPMILSRTCR